MNHETRVSVIIASLADRSRAELLERAIESVLTQRGVRAVPIVVVNGGRHDDGVLGALKRNPDIRCIHFSHGGLPEARLKGREAVDTPFFAYLDDDDELLPGSIEVRHQPMLADDSIDVVVSNGFRISAAGQRTITDTNIDRFQKDPLRGLLEGNWLNESGGLFRTATVGLEFFAGLPPVVEWTYIAFQLAQRRKICFINEQTFIKHDTLASLSKSQEYLLQLPSVLLRILELPMPDDVRENVKRMYVSALHNLSMWFLEIGEFRSAWIFHLKSATHMAGWRYLPYTRHILWQQLARKYGHQTLCRTERRGS